MAFYLKKRYFTRQPLPGEAVHVDWSHPLAPRKGDAFFLLNGPSTARDLVSGAKVEVTANGTWGVKNGRYGVTSTAADQVTFQTKSGETFALNEFGTGEFNLFTKTFSRTEAIGGATNPHVRINQGSPVRRFDVLVGFDWVAEIWKLSAFDNTSSTLSNESSVVERQIQVTRDATNLIFKEHLAGDELTGASEGIDFDSSMTNFVMSGGAWCELVEWVGFYTRPLNEGQAKSLLANPWQCLYKIEYIPISAPAAATTTTMVPVRQYATSQPTGSGWKVDWSGIGKGLTSFMTIVGNEPYDFVNGKMTPIGTDQTEHSIETQNTGRQASRVGNSADGGSGGPYAGWSVALKKGAPTYPVTLVGKVWNGPENWDSYSGGGLCRSSDDQIRGFYLGFGWNGDDIGFRQHAGFSNYDTAADLNDETWTTVGGETRGGSNTDKTLYIDGVSATKDVDEGNSGDNNTSTWQKAFWGSTTTNRVTTKTEFVAVWDRILSPAEHQAMHKNPWQIFYREVLIPIVTGAEAGGESHTSNITKGSLELTEKSIQTTHNEFVQGNVTKGSLEVTAKSIQTTHLENDRADIPKGSLELTKKSIQTTHLENDRGDITKGSLELTKKSIQTTHLDSVTGNITKGSLELAAKTIQTTHVDSETGNITKGSLQLAAKTIQTTHLEAETGNITKGSLELTAKTISTTHLENDRADVPKGSLELTAKTISTTHLENDRADVPKASLELIAKTIQTTHLEAETGNVTKGSLELTAKTISTTHLENDRADVPKGALELTAKSIVSTTTESVIGQVTKGALALSANSITGTTSQVIVLAAETKYLYSVIQLQLQEYSVVQTAHEGLSYCQTDINKPSRIRDGE